MMPCRSWLPLLLLLVHVLAPRPARGSGLWEASPPLAGAVQKAARKGNLLVVKVSTSWCGACRKLEQELTHPEVVKVISGFFRLAYDAEQGEGVDVARRYNVITFPTLLLLDSEAVEVGRVTGYLSGEELAGRLGDLARGEGTLERLERTLQKTPTDGKLRLELGTAWAVRGEKARARTHLDRLVDLDARPAAAPGGPVPSTEAQDLAASALLVRGKFLEQRSLGDNKAALATLELLRSRYPGSPQAQQAVYPMAQALKGLGQTARALSLLAAWAGKGGGAEQASRHAAAAWFCLREGIAGEQGLGHARQAVKLDPGQAEAWATLAALEERAGQIRAAHDAMDRAARLDPGNAQYRQQRDLLMSRLARQVRLPAPQKQAPSKKSAK